MKKDDINERRRQEDKAVFNVFHNSPDGKVVLKRFRRDYDSHNEGADGISIARYEGRRDVVKDIEDIIAKFKKEVPDGIS